MSGSARIHIEQYTKRTHPDQRGTKKVERDERFWKAGERLNCSKECLSC